MDKLLYLSMTGARETMLAQTAHANNLANVNTTGFKSDLAQARAMPVFGEGHASRVYAMTENPATRFDAGAMNQTGRELDVAIEGEGWLAVQAPDGSEAYTRAGELHIDATGQVVTGRGLPLLGGGGPIVLPPAEKIDIGQDGSISVRPLGAAEGDLVIVDQIKLVNPPAESLRKGADGLMRIQAADDALNGAPGDIEADPQVRLAAGYLETSNVNAVAEMTAILDLSRRFEMNIKMMTDAKENAEAAARILQNLG